MHTKELEEKIKHVRHIVRKHKKRGAIISEFYNLCWLGIHRPHVLSLSENTVVKIEITQEDVFLVTNNIEAQRIYNEEMDENLHPFFNKKVYQWYEAEQDVYTYKPDAYLKDKELEQEIKLHRMCMNASERQQSIELGLDMVAIIEATLKYIKSGKTEREISSWMHKLCVEKGIDVGLAICADWKRVLDYRHPIATDTPIEDMCMLALTVRRHGIYSCMSRMVALKVPDEALLKKRDAVLAVDAACQAYTQSGANVRNVFCKIQEEYQKQGLEGEWKNHHQGGITGYKSREEKICGTSDIDIQEHMLFAYNPSVAGYKTEDTFFIDKGKKIVTTYSEKLPLIEIEFEGNRYMKPDIIRLYD